MRSIRNIQINKSIEKGELVYDESGWDKFDTYTNYVASIALILLALAGLYRLDQQKGNDLAFTILFVVVALLLGSYHFYRQWAEKKLIKIDSKFRAEEIKGKLLDYAANEEYEIYRQKGYCLILNETTDLTGDRYKRSSIILIRDHVVYFAVMQDNFRLNSPVYTSHLTLKRDLRKLLN